MFQLADELVQKWGNTPPRGAHCAAWDMLWHGRVSHAPVLTWQTSSGGQYRQKVKKKLWCGRFKQILGSNFTNTSSLAQFRSFKFISISTCLSLLFIYHVSTCTCISTCTSTCMAVSGVVSTGAGTGRRWPRGRKRQWKDISERSVSGEGSLSCY